jgi:peptidyl-tRNA hydrolase
MYTQNKWVSKIALTKELILSKDEVYIDQSGNTELVFKDIYRLYNEDIIFLE